MGSILLFAPPFFRFFQRWLFSHIFVSDWDGRFVFPILFFTSPFFPPTFIIYPHFSLHYVLLFQIPLVRGRIGFVCPFKVVGEASLEFAGMLVVFYEKKDAWLAATFASLITRCFILCRNLFCSKYIGNIII
jgi:hypothetical protein